VFPSVIPFIADHACSAGVQCRLVATEVMAAPQQQTAAQQHRLHDSSRRTSIATVLRRQGEGRFLMNERVQGLPPFGVDLTG
jgi:hypothetical protein